MNQSSIALAAGALILAGISSASAQSLIVEERAYASPVYDIAASAPMAIEPAPRVYMEPAPRVYVAPAPRVYTAPVPRVYTTPAPAYVARAVPAQTVTREVLVTETEPTWSASARVVYRGW